MKRFSAFMACCFILLFSNCVYATNIQGKVVDAKDNTSLPGATVVVPGTSTGTITSLDGSFSLALPSGYNTITISFIGYVNDTFTIDANNPNLGIIKLKSQSVGLAEVYVSASIAIDRETPIAVSNVKIEQIEQKLGSQEFPEILKSTPGIYATKRGGGFGDADVRIRGFGSNNVAVLINGMPVNGMEDDRVYWSNWAGLANVSRTIQVQRGVGASKITVPSVGGTINVITKTTDAEAGGNVFYTHGNDNYHKYGARVSSGLTANNWAATVMVSHVTGNGYVEGTPFEGYSYFLNVSKKINNDQQVALTVFGAPQEHARRYAYKGIDVLKERNQGHKYNSDWGNLNGQFYSNSTNFYHKPVAMLNHYWNIDNTTFLSNTFYASVGIGGGGYATETDYNLEYNALGQIDWDKAVLANQERAQNGDAAGVYFKNSYNYHSWYGALSSLKKQVGNVNILAGADLRYYYGQHWQQADDLLGANSVKDKNNVDAIYLYNNEVQQGGTIFYDNDGEIWWEGLFVQGEYKNGNISAFVSATVSNKSYRRHDFAQYFSESLKNELKNSPELQQYWEEKLADYMKAHKYETILESDAYTVGQRTEWRHFLGYSAKAGANYNINNHHNIFINGGYMERQPIFSTVFQDYRNLINTSAVNEKVISGEIGYGYRSAFFTANLNAYYTLWNDKTYTGFTDDPDDPNEVLFYNIEGVNARHTGIEFDFVARPVKNLDINGMVSIGDWIWNNNVDTVNVFKDQLIVKKIPALFLKGVHVADAAQSSASLGVNYELLPGLKIGADAFYFDRLYSDFDLESRITPEDEGEDAYRVPNYFLIDMNVYYKFSIGKFKSSIYGNMHNVLNTIYIADSRGRDEHYYGFGRTWTCGMKIYF